MHKKINIQKPRNVQKYKHRTFLGRRSLHSPTRSVSALAMFPREVKRWPSAVIYNYVRMQIIIL